MRTSGDTNARSPAHSPTASQVQRAPLRTAGWLLIRTSRAPSAIYSAAGGFIAFERVLMLPVTAFLPEGGFQHTARTQQVKGRSQGHQKGGFFCARNCVSEEDV